MTDDIAILNAKCDILNRAVARLQIEQSSKSLANVKAAAVEVVRCAKISLRIHWSKTDARSGALSEINSAADNIKDCALNIPIIQRHNKNVQDACRKL